MLSYEEVVGKNGTEGCMWSNKNTKKKKKTLGKGSVSL